MENIIFNELRARGYSVDVGMVEIESRKDGKREKLHVGIIPFLLDRSLVGKSRISG